MRARLLLAALVLLAAPWAGPAAADSYPPGGVHVVTGEVSATVLPDGGTVRFSGGGFAPLSLLRLSVDGVQRGSTTGDGSGSFSVTFTLTGGGDQVLAASGLEPSGRVRVVSATVTVSEAAGAGLPTTGAQRLAPALGVGLGSVTVGAALVLVARARRRRPVAV